MGKSSRILLTGGHAATTGIAVIEELKKRTGNAEIYWIGAKSAISGSGATTLEHKIYPSLGVKYFEIKAGKLQTKFTRYTIPLILTIPIGFIQALFLVIKIKPEVILSLGGFASFPVVFWGWVMGVPVILHEQTLAAGRATISSAFFARKIALGRSESLKYFPPGKCVVTGNPLTSSVLSVRPIKKPHNPITILIMGGSRGSEFINEEIIKIVPELSAKYKIIHITGERDFEMYKDLAGRNYEVLSFVDPKDMDKYYSRSDIIISRSGANTVAEIIYIKRPAILIPLPRTFMNEQYKNADYAKKIGIAKVLTEKEVNPESLLSAIEETMTNWEKIVTHFLGYKSPDEASAKKLVDLLTDFL